MPTSGRHLERALGALLSAHVAQIRQHARRTFERRLRPRQRLHALEVIDEREQMRRGQHVHIVAGPRGLWPALGRADETLTQRVGADGGRQRPRHRADGAVERQLAHGRKPLHRIGCDGAHGHHQSEHDGEIEVAAFLGQIRRREIDGHVLVRKPEPHGMQRIAHPLAAFGNGFIGETDDHERRRTGRDPHLHFHRARFDADERQRRDGAIHARPRTHYSV